MAITVTFIRHGESEDNLKGIWAGWKDAPLSELGRQQAQALGKHLSSTKIDIIYASPLLRAHATGLAVQAGQQQTCLFVNNPKFRERHHGIAEGKPWTLSPLAGKSLEEGYAQGAFPVLSGRDEKFPEGESLNDLALRCEEAIAECVLPYVGQDGFHIALVSHSMCISELVAALLRLDPESRRDASYAELLNTAWTRAVISLPDGTSTATHDPAKLLPLKVVISHINKTEHLANLVPTSTSELGKSNDMEDAQQAEARAFFGGGGKAAEAAKRNL